MGMVHNKTTQVTTVGLADSNTSCTRVVLIPGINQIDDEIIRKIKEHPHVKQRVKDDQLQFLSPTKLDKKNNESKEDMLNYIPKIFDTKLLKKLIKEDPREIVVAAAKDQLDKILNPATEDNKGSDEHFK